MFKMLIMGRIIYLVIVISIFLFGLVGCRDRNTETMTIYITSNIDTTLLLVNMDMKKGFDPYCYMNCIERIDPGSTVVMYKDRDKYMGVSLTMNVYRDLFDNRIDKDTLSDCTKRKIIMEKGIIRQLKIPDWKLEKINYSIVLDSVILGLKN